jgi:hypothetical protein
VVESGTETEGPKKAEPNVEGEVPTKEVDNPVPAPEALPKSN